MAGQKAIMSDNIWTTMRITIALLGRTVDLCDACDARDLDRFNREFNIEWVSRLFSLLKLQIANAMIVITGIFMCFVYIKLKASIICMYKCIISEFMSVHPISC